MSFSCVKQIGKGGYGVVYLVKSLRDNSYKVVKEIDISNFDEMTQQKISKEVEIISKLKHPNIIEYHSHKLILNKKIQILMDYADNGDLSKKIFTEKYQCNNKPIPEEIIIHWFVQMCLALKYIHDRKIIHRDIKPSNFFLTQSGVIKLGDFGLSTYIDNTTGFVHSRWGTPYYLSPEICSENFYNQKSDVWSLGCVLYELCTYKKAFDGITMNHIIHNIINNESPKLPKGTYSDELNNLISSMLIKDPQKRPTINDILKLPIIKAKAISLLGIKQSRLELGHTMFHGFEPCESPNEFKEKLILYIDNNENNDLKFMGKNIALPDLMKCESLSVRAESLRALIEEMIGDNKLEELCELMRNGNMNVENSNKWVVQLVQQLMALEEMVNMKENHPEICEDK